MSQNFSVNGKEYILSSTLAATFGYTSDYIGRLAREEKILGSLVGRQWFIEPESLKVFITQTQIEKEIRKEALSAERKLSQKVRPQKNIRIKQSELSFLIFAQTLVILFCGLFVGGLGWVISVEKIGKDEVVNGVAESWKFIAQSMIPIQFDLTSEVESDSLLAASAEVVPIHIPKDVSPTEIFTVLPLFSPRVQISSSTASSTMIHDLIVGQEFSDEVRITFDENGNKVIDPVFKSRAMSSDRFLVTPFKEVES